jgi:hypothetical protein
MAAGEPVRGSRYSYEHPARAIARTWMGRRMGGERIGDRLKAHRPVVPCPRADGGLSHLQGL